MFVAQAKYDELLSRATRLTEDNAALQGQINTLTEQVGQITSLQEQVSALTTERDTANAAGETASQQIAELTDQVNDLIKENEDLKKLPGAESATTRSQTEQANGEAINDLDKLNEFCKNNSGNVNACVAAVEKYNNQ